MRGLKLRTHIEAVTFLLKLSGKIRNSQEFRTSLRSLLYMEKSVMSLTTRLVCVEQIMQYLYSTWCWLNSIMGECFIRVWLFCIIFKDEHSDSAVFF